MDDGGGGYCDVCCSEVGVDEDEDCASCWGFKRFLKPAGSAPNM